MSNGDDSLRILQPPYPTDHQPTEHPDLFAHVNWCLTKSGGTQDGIELYEAGTWRLCPWSAIRDRMYLFQQHNEGAQNVIKGGSNVDLRNCIARALPGIEHEVEAHLRWVAHHKGRVDDLRRARDNNSGGHIRSIFNSEQSHNEKARVLLKAVSDPFLFSLIDHC